MTVLYIAESETFLAENNRVEHAPPERCGETHVEEVLLAIDQDFRRSLVLFPSMLQFVIASIAESLKCFRLGVAPSAWALSPLCEE